MAKLKIYSEITDKETKVFYSWLGLDAVCFEDVQTFIESIPANDDKIDIYLHCPGGSCREGFAMYDALRTSGKTITTIVDGEAASMATIIMMAAPKERRYAQKNASIYLHRPFYGCYYEYLEQAHVEDLETLANKMRIQADELRDVEKKIIDIYVERTGTDRETIISLMEDDRFITTDRAKELGLIGDTLEPNTDKKLNNMSKVSVEAGIFAKMLKKLGISKVEDFKAQDMVITSADGSELSIDREEGNPAVEDTASPDGEFVMEDGSTIVIADGKITDIKPKPDETGDDPEEEDPEEEDPEEEDPEEEDLEEGGPEEGGGDDDDDEGGEGGEGGGDALKALQTENASLKDTITSLKAQAKTEDEVSMLASIPSMKQQIADLTAERDALKASQKSEQETAILDKVNALGGMEWLDKAGKLASTFVPEKGGFAEHNSEGNSVKFDSFLEARANAFRRKF